MIRILVTGPYEADIELDGVKVAKAFDCDLNRWVIVRNDGDTCGYLDGCYPANNHHDLAFAIYECHGDLTEIPEVVNSEEYHNV